MRTMAGLGVRPGGYDAKARLTDMDSEGVDKAVLFPSIAFYGCETPDLDLDKAMCRAYNNWLADHCAEAPDRLFGVTILPLRDIDASITELERCTERFGFRGAFFRPNPYGGRVIQAPAYDRFWDCCQSLGVAVSVHEGISDTLPTLGRDRVDNVALLHLFEHPFEQMTACASVIMTGVLERFPRLKFAFLESGCEWLPYWLDRMDGHYEQWGRLFPAMRMTPSEYFRRQCYVSCDPDESFVPTVVENIGDGNLLWATDYPHADGPFPGAVEMTLQSFKTMPLKSRKKILETNPMKLFGIEA
jgi:predicted TIM-barrel fold metal-dependent hydrolase